MKHSEISAAGRSHVAHSCLLLMGMLLLSGCERVDELGPTAQVSVASNIREAFASSETGSLEEKVVSTGTGWGTLKGQFIYDGNPPEMPPYNVNKDVSTCTINGQAPKQEWLLVDSETSGIANVVIFARKVNRVHESMEAQEESKIFDQQECVFLSHVFPLVVGQTVEIKNSDPVGHNTNIESRYSGFNQTIPADGSVAYVPQREEAAPVAVRCSIHPWMLAYMLPRENPYFAVTVEDGTFEIPNLPAEEEIEFQVWHESAPGGSGGLALEGGQANELGWTNRGRFTIQLEQDEVMEINMVVPPAALGQ